MSTELWILIGIGLLIALSLAYYIITQVLRAREDFKKIDRSKLREWQDDDW